MFTMPRQRAIGSRSKLRYRSEERSKECVTGKGIREPSPVARLNAPPPPVEMARPSNVALFSDGKRALQASQGAECRAENSGRDSRMPLTKHGRYSRAAKAEREYFRTLLKECRGMLRNSLSTAGPHPSRDSKCHSRIDTYMYLDTHFAAQAIRNYYADFMRLKTAQTPPGDIAYVNLLGQLAAELEGEYPGKGGNALAACSSAITSTFVDMMVLAYPKLFIPLDKK